MSDKRSPPDKDSPPQESDSDDIVEQDFIRDIRFWLSDDILNSPPKHNVSDDKLTVVSLPGHNVLRFAEWVVRQQRNRGWNQQRYARALMEGKLQELKERYDVECTSTEDIAEELLRIFDRPPPILPSPSTAVTKEYEPTPGHKMKNRPKGLKYRKRKRAGNNDEEVSSLTAGFGSY